MSRRSAVQVGAAAFGTAVFGVMFLTGPHGNTYAAFSDSTDITGNSAMADVWTPDPPVECGPLSDYSAIVYGGPGADTIYGDDLDASTGVQSVVRLHGHNRSQIIMGMGGDDVLKGGNGKDCLVGGDGNDTVAGGNAPDILIGGPGDDTLIGVNGPDTLDGGSGADNCSGGGGPDTIINCESSTAQQRTPAPALAVPSTTTAEPTSTTPAEPTSTPTSDAPTSTDSAAVSGSGTVAP